jgi:hypothetical protein
LAAGRALPNASSTDGFGDDAERADAFAQAVDMAYGSGGYTVADLQQIFGMSSIIWALGRSPVTGPEGLRASGYTALANGIVGAVQAGTAQIESEGIDPNGCGGGSGPTTPNLNIVYVSHAGSGDESGSGPSNAKPSPYSANAFDWVVVDASAGVVDVVLPAMTKGQWASVAQDSNTAFSNQIVVSVNGGGKLDQPAPLNGTFVTSVAFGPGTNWTATGNRLQWYNGTSNGGLLLE